jgi:hypothetical protein
VEYLLSVIGHISQKAVWSEQLFYSLGYEPGMDEAKSESFLNNR